MKFITNIKNYLNNWPEDNRFTPFWRSTINGILAIPRALLFFGIPAIITLIFIRLIDYILFGKHLFTFLKEYPPTCFISEIGWWFIFYCIVTYFFGCWLEK